MQRPRRTTEYETPSTAPRASRPSRLQQPLRRPSFREGSLTRSSSAEPLNTLGVTNNYLSVPSSGKPHRSSSVSNVRTPQRTPTNATPSKVQYTGEKQRAPINDKRWIQEQVAKITEYLKTVDCGVNTDFLYRGGLKTMSIKQFIGIVNYFLKFVAGNKFSVGPNHVESISKILNQIEYPYTVNKSWLKTPTAPHAFGNAVMLFSYFMEFIPPTDNLDSFKKNYLIVSEEYPDMEFAFKMVTMAEEGFTLWNNQKNEEFEKLQRAAVDELIFKKSSIAGCDALEDEIKRLNTELDKIVNKKAVIADEEEYFRLDKELKTNQRTIAKLQKVRQDNQKQMKKLESEIKVQVEQIAKIETRINDIRNVVDTQEVSIEKRNRLIEEIGQMQYILKTKKQSVCDLQEMDHKSQIQLSRNIKLLTERIAKFNSYVRQIMMDFEDLDVDAESLCLHQNTDIELQDQLNEIVVFLKRLQNHIASRMEELSKRSEALETQKNLIFYEIAEWIEPKTKETSENVKEGQRRIDEIDREIIAVKNYQTNRLNDYAHKLKLANESVDTLKKAIEHNRQELVRVKEENDTMMAVVKERFSHTLTIRETKLNRFQDALQLLQKKCIEVRTLMK